MQEKSLQEYLYSSNQIQVIVENEYKNITNVDEVNDIMRQMLEDSRDMPAFGVGIHDYTMEDMKSGAWIRFKYDKTQIVNEMPFDELLVKVSPDFSGFNVMRGNDGRYEGRCYYIALNKTMENLYQFIIND